VCVSFFFRVGEWFVFLSACLCDMTQVAESDARCVTATLDLGEARDMLELMPDDEVNAPGTPTRSGAFVRWLQTVPIWYQILEKRERFR